MTTIAWPSCGCAIDWVAAGTFLSCFVLAVSAWLIRGQIKAVRQAMYSQSWSVAVTMIDDPLAQRITADFFQRDGQTPRPTPAEFFTGNITVSGGLMSRAEAASLLCDRYDAVAVMVRFEMLPADVVLSARAATIVRLWTILMPHINERRGAESSPGKWSNFIQLAGTAQSHAQPQSVST